MNTLVLPEDYNLIETVDLTKDKRALRSLSGGFLSIFIFGILLGHIFSPYNIFRMGFRNFLTLGIFYIINIIVHELIHGITIKLTTGFKVEYGFNWNYAYAGNTKAYFNRVTYIIIALAPVVILGIIYFLLLIYLPASFFWLFYMLQIFNISGALGDFYMVKITRDMPKDMLVNDSGFVMKFYAREE